jgi:hypothetical protein
MKYSAGKVRLPHIYYLLSRPTVPLAMIIRYLVAPDHKKQWL